MIPSPVQPDAAMFEYTARYPTGRVVTFVGRIVERIPCEMYSRATGEFFTGVKLVLENAKGRRMTTLGMRDLSAQRIPHV